MPHLSLTFLGSIQIILAGAPVALRTDKERALLAYLAIESDRPHRRDTLASLLWPNQPDGTAHANLRQSLYRLRRSIETNAGDPSFLDVSANSIQFNSQGDYALDVQEFTSLVAECERHLHASLESCQACGRSLSRVADLYRGDLLGGFFLPDCLAFEEWALAKREGLHRQALEALHWLAAYCIGRAEYSSAERYAQQQLTLEPWREVAHRQLMRALALSGQRTAALRQYETCRRILQKELGVEPSEETKSLVKHLQLDNLPLAAPVPAAAPADRPPFKGMQYFEEGDAGLFFGREQVTANLARQLRESLERHAPSADHARQLGRHCRFLALVGASGSGKSSILRAGLIPALKTGQMLADGSLPPDGSPEWPIFVITPGARPLKSLAVSLTLHVESATATSILQADFSVDPRCLDIAVTKLLQSGRYPGQTNERRALIVVDQFEELFTLCDSETERRAFIDNLLTAALEPGGLTSIVIALRADFYSHCAPYPSLREWLTRRQVFIGAMDADEMRRAIEKPAERGGWVLEPGLVELVLRDVGSEPGALPLLSHAMLETWERRSKRVLTVVGYTDSGGVRGAIAQTAESVFNRQLTEEQQPIARNIFLRLTELGEGTEDTRRRATLPELVPHQTHQPLVTAVLEILAEARLITIGEEVVEIAHEALIQEWPRLREWLVQDRERLRLHRKLTEAAHEWEANHRDASLLYRGTRLAQIGEWIEDSANLLSSLENQFLAASRAQAEREAADREAQHQRELETAQQLAKAERQRAEENLRAAAQLRRRRLYLLLALAATGVLAAVAIFLGGRAQAQAVNNAKLVTQNAAIAGTAQAASTLAVAESFSRATQEAQAVFNAATSQANFSRAEAQRLAAEAKSLSEQNGRTELIALLSLRSVRTLYTAEGDAALAQALTLDYPLGLFTAAADAVNAAALSPDNQAVVGASSDGKAYVWDAATWQELTTLIGHEGALYAVAYSHDGRYILTGGLDKTARLWDARTGEQLRVFEGHADRLNDVAFSPDDAYALTSSGDHTAILWDVESGRPLRQFVGHSDGVSGVAFSPDARYALTGSSDRTARLWNVQTGAEVRVFSGHTDRVLDVAFSPDGRQILSGSYDNSARLWEAATGTLVRQFTGHSLGLTSVAFSPDGNTILTGSYDSTARLWDRQTGVELRRLVNHSGGVISATFSNDGHYVLTGGIDAAVRLWSAAPRRALPELNGHSSAVLHVAFSPDGRWALTGSQDKTAKLWDARTGQELVTFTGHQDVVNGVDFSPDGKSVLTASWDGTVRLWDAKTGVELRHFDHPTGALTAVFSPDGKTILSGGWNKTARLWDAQTGAALHVLAGHTELVYGVAFSRDGKYALTASFDGTAKLWDTQTGSEVRTFIGHTNSVTSVAFSPDGKYAATGSYDNTARLWDTQTGETIRIFAGHRDFVWAVAFSPDGQHLLTASYDNTARLWDVAPGAEIRRIIGHTAGLETAAYSPDGKYILTGSDDNSARLWFADSADMVGYLCDRLLRDFSDSERVQYGITDQTPTCK